MDAYAGLCIYQKLQTVSVPGNIPEKHYAGLPVSLYQDDGQSVIAYGYWSRVNIQSNPEVQTIKVSKGLAAVEITEVLIPGAILDLHQKSLASCGPAPFIVVCKKAKFQTMPAPSATTVGESSTSNLHNVTHLNTSEDFQSVSNEDKGQTQESWLADAEESTSPDFTGCLKNTTVDTENQQIGKTVLDELANNPEIPI